MPASLNVVLDKKSKQDLLAQNESMNNSTDYWNSKNLVFNAQKSQQKQSSSTAISLKNSEIK